MSCICVYTFFVFMHPMYEYKIGFNEMNKRVICGFWAAVKYNYTYNAPAARRIDTSECKNVPMFFFTAAFATAFCIRQFFFCWSKVFVLLRVRFICESDLHIYYNNEYACVCVWHYHGWKNSHTYTNTQHTHTNLIKTWTEKNHIIQNMRAPALYP